MTEQAGALTIRFDSTLSTIGKSTILRLPEKASAELPSRGQVAVHGTVNGHQFDTVLEPDGSFGHWIRVDRKLQRTAGMNPGDTAMLEIQPSKEWPEPAVPQDLHHALELPRRRSRTSGRTSRPWRAGNGFAG